MFNDIFQKKFKFGMFFLDMATIKYTKLRHVWKLTTHSHKTGTFSKGIG